MARFTIAGRGSAIADQIGSKIMEQADAGGGFNESQRKQVDLLSKTLQELAKQFPSDANISASGNISYTGTSMDATIDFHANHPNIGTDTGYTEPQSVHQPDGSGQRLQANANKDSQEEPADVTKFPTGDTPQKNDAQNPFAKVQGGSQVGSGVRTERSEHVISRDPLTQPTDR